MNVSKFYVNPTYDQNTQKAIMNFHASTKKDFTGFKRITPERKMELDSIIEKISTVYQNKFYSTNRIMLKTSEKLTTRAKEYGITNGDEKYYFYIKLVDPNLDLLSKYLEINDKELFKSWIIKNYAVYDNILIQLEYYYQRAFFKPELEEENIQKR